MIDWQLDQVHIYIHTLHVTRLQRRSAVESILSLLNFIPAPEREKQDIKHLLCSCFIMWPVSIQVVELSPCQRGGEAIHLRFLQVWWHCSLAAHHRLTVSPARRIDSWHEGDEGCERWKMWYRTSQRATLERDWILFIRENLGAISFNLFQTVIKILSW